MNDYYNITRFGNSVYLGIRFRSYLCGGFATTISRMNLNFKLPNWLRDLVGILKLTFAIMLFNDNLELIQIGASGIALLMIAALFTHIRQK